MLSLAAAAIGAFLAFLFGVPRYLSTPESGKEHGVMGDPTGEADTVALRLDFDRRLLLQFRGPAITSDAGLQPYRQLDNTLGLTDRGAKMGGSDCPYEMR
jgi:hypothetical protein